MTAALRGSSSAPSDQAAPASRRALPGRLVPLLWFGVAAILVILDQATKYLAEVGLPSPPGRIDLGFFDLRLVYNPGGAFGVRAFPGLFVIVTTIVLILVVRALPRTDRLGLAAAYGLVTGGALGNLIDRLFRPPGFPAGEVVDFLDLRWWPVFNVADVAIVTGAFTIAFLLTIVDREERSDERARAEHRSVRPHTSLGDLRHRGGRGGEGALPLSLEVPETEPEPRDHPDEGRAAAG